jgi:NADPH2:quinone reductase
MTKAIVIEQTGGPEVLQWKDIQLMPPGPGEARVQHAAVGLNFIDVYHRTGLYPLPALPATPGMEAAGVVQAVGPDVTDVSVGDRVAYAAVPPGAYSETRNIPADRLVALPDEIGFEQAAAMMLQGMTARYLLRGCFNVKPGTWMLIHAAAGGVGAIACQWAHHLGAHVIGTVGNSQKAEIARAHGCDYPILYEEVDFVAQVKKITQGRGVDVVYDSVGEPTFLKSLDCLRPMGYMVSFGQAAAPVSSFNPALLAAKGSLFLTRPTLMTYTARREDLLAHARDLFDVVASGAVKIEINQRYPLKEAARAHRALEARQTMGSSIFLLN